MPNRLGHACLAVFALLVALVWPGGALAQSREAEAKVLFERGLEASDQKRWAEAADFFQRSRELVERPSTLFNLVVSLHQLGRYRDGLEAGAAYLRVASGDPDVQKRIEVERLLSDMVAAVGTLTLTVHPPGASVVVDQDVLVPEAGPYRLTLDPGRHQLRVKAPGHEPYAEAVAIERGGRLSREVTLVPAAQTSLPPAHVVPADEAAVAVSERADAPPLTKKQKRRRRALWITGTMLVVGGLAAAIVVSQPEPERPQPTGGTTGITLPL